MLLFVTYIVVTCTYRDYFWKATQEIGNFVAYRTAWDTLEE